MKTEKEEEEYKVKMEELKTFYFLLMFILVSFMQGSNFQKLYQN